jgi:hypothetical protein
LFGIPELGGFGIPELGGILAQKGGLEQAVWR